MNSVGQIVTELLTSVAASTAVSTAVDASPLLTALITLGVSLVTVVGGELVKYLVALLKKKTKDLEGKDEDNG